MRKRRRVIDEPVQPSLVPMVDLLSNTVGALVFIMIFTVMAASGVVVVKRLPLERQTEFEPVNFLCERDRIIPLDNRGLDSKLKSRWGRPYSLFDIYSWIARFNDLEVEDEHFIARGESTVSPVTLSVLFTPKPEGGYSIAEIQPPGSKYRGRLAAVKADKEFVHFLVKPDAVASFVAARKIAADEMGFGTGWIPLAADTPIRFTSRGRALTEQ
jgi:hypothetical protein